MRARHAGRQIAAAVVGIGLTAVVQSAPAAGAERAYELVTPPGSHAEIRPGGGASTPDGEVVCFNSETAIAGAPSNGIDTADDGFCARRTASGWKTTWVTGPAVRDLRGGLGAQVYFVSPDGARVAFASDMGIFPDFPGNPPGSPRVGTLSAFMWENGTTRWLAPAPEPLPEERPQLAERPGFFPASYVAREPLAASEDLSRGIFVSSLGLVPQDTNGLLDVYEWTPDGIELVSRGPAGTAVGGWPAMGLTDQAAAVPGTISRDGARVFFEHVGALDGSPDGLISVFMRRGDELRNVSPRRGPGPAQEVLFAGASADGRTVFLSSQEQLTADPTNAGDKLYRYDIDADQLSLVASAADGSGIVMLGASADGSTVVYRTGGFPPELFVEREGVSSSLGLLEFQDTNAFFDSFANERSDKRALRISDDGKTVVFASFAGFDGTAAGTRQVYRWTPVDGVRRISIDASHSAPRTAAAIGNFTTPFPGEPRQSLLNFMRSRPNLGRVMSDDGRRVFFETADPLVDADSNRFVDVYEWRDGEVRLVTPGTQAGDALYHDSSADGRTVFFTTMARVIPELDRNTTPDLYAAREGGGFPLPPSVPGCGGDDCQGQAPPPPSTPQPPGSATFDGPADRTDPAPVAARLTIKRLTAAQRRAFARSGRIVLQVRATKRGVVTTTARSRVGRRTAIVGRAVRMVPGTAMVRMAVQLSPRARAVLRAKRRLRVVITASYSESEKAIRQAVVLNG